AGDKGEGDAYGALVDPTGMARHDYWSGPTVVCEAELACTANEMADYARRFAYPGQWVLDPVVSGQQYLVKDMWLGIPWGWVTTVISGDGLTIMNITEMMHVFCCGIIERTLTVDDDGTWYMTTHGTGFNLPGLNVLNQFAGKAMFDNIDFQMHNRIRWDHGLNN